jgi:hypothetical protein
MIAKMIHFLIHSLLDSYILAKIFKMLLLGLVEAFQKMHNNLLNPKEHKQHINGLKLKV